MMKANLKSMLKSVAGMDASVKVGWAGFGGAGLDTSEGDTERAGGTVASSLSSSGSSWIRSIFI